jgi:hypothetical protein
MCAAIGGDRELCRRLALAYQLHIFQPQRTGHAPVGLWVIRHLFAGDEKSATQACALFNDALGDPIDFPPCRFEIVFGILRRDPALIVEGMRRVNIRFESRWDVKRVRAWYDKQTSPTRRVNRRLPSFNEVLEGDGQTLVSFGWVLSTWALGLLNLARWHGMKSPFDQPKLFSEWIPLELCT